VQAPRHTQAQITATGQQHAFTHHVLSTANLRSHTRPVRSRPGAHVPADLRQKTSTLASGMIFVTPIGPASICA
jgi:hypothetical protein